MNPTSLEAKREAFNNLKALIETRIKNEQADPGNPLYKKFPTTWSFPDGSGWTLLGLAIQLDDMDAVKDLIENKQVSAREIISYDDMSPLEVALTNERPSIAEYLLKHGADVTDCLRAWISMGPSLDLYDKYLRERIEVQKNKNMAGLADPVGLNDKSLLDFAAELGDIETLKQYDDRYKLATVFNKNSHTTNLLLHAAIANNEYNTVKFLLEKNASLHTVDSSLCTPLHRAASLGSSDIVELLISKGAGINDRSISGWTPLFTAILRGRVNSAKVLQAHGADLSMRSYLGETIFHAATSHNIDLVSLFPEINLDLLKLQKNIFNELPADYKGSLNSIGLEQTNLIKKFFYYGQLNYRDMSYINKDGYCNGLAFLFQYYDSYHKLEEYFSIIQTIARWDGTINGLQCKPLPPLDKVYSTVGHLFEEFLSFAIFFQENLNEFNLNQKDRCRQMALLDQPIELTMACSNYHLTRERLSEMVRIIQKCPPNTRVELGGFSHVTTLKKEADNSIVYYDCNLTKRLPTAGSDQTLCDIILNTKYHKLDDKHELTSINGAPVAYDIRFMMYHFPWDNYPKDFNYFSDEELPKTAADVRTFQLQSPNHFSPLHVAIMTNSKENFKQLLASNVCEIDETALEIAFYCADKEMIECLLQKDIHWQNPEIFKKINDNDLQHVMDTIINMPSSNNLNRFLDIGVYDDNLELVKKLFIQHKINLRESLSRVVSYLNYDDVADEIKLFLHQQYKFIIDKDGRDLLHLSILNAKNDCLAFLLKQDPTQLTRDPSESFFKWLNKFRPQKNQPISLEQFSRSLSIILDHLPPQLSLQDGCYLLNTLHDCGEPLLSRYAGKVCSSIENVNKLLGTSIFKFTLLQVFAHQLDDVITLELLKHVDHRTVNFQNHETKNTALHTVLSLAPRTDKERQKFYKIIAALKAKTDLSLPNRDGICCQTLIEQHFDPKVRDILLTMSIKPRMSVAA